ncbi:EFR1 family ferrodoxin [Fusibacter ferrireducens]|uniref:EFR1 family ferrodoxin n=1 Tax=Fusibacter ferrireducens TaxID=2785058 RepID=A0ABR9ZXQ8_9FIRM|nr:EFR1 family ferrodoxin [Fusibacter ferrireducens]MBF4694650.1 EFR1 family ferrodoxin [Fusibacter ferrireducens]
MKTQKTAICYFSGTGNTKVVSELLAKEIAKIQGNMTILRNIEDMLRDMNGLIHMAVDLIGIAYPIYGFGTPEIIKHFVDQFEPVQDRKVFILLTGADYIRINHNATASIKRKLQKKGYEVIYERIIAMGSNWLMAYDDHMVRLLYQAAQRKVVHMSIELQNEVRRIYQPNIAIRSTAPMINFCEEKMGAKIFGRFLYANPQCNHCGRCVKHCPSQNIRLEEGQIKFGNKCYMCMRCIYTCSQKAIEAGTMQFVVLKNGYDIENLINNSPEEEPFIESNLVGYFKHFIAYLKDDTM